MFTVTIDTQALSSECDALLDEIERASFAGLDAAARATALEARSSHWYRNRTGDLESSTRAVNAEGDLWSDSANSAVAATEPYASYVDARAPILTPAWDAVQGRVVAEFEQLLEAACR